jgi:PAS domain S-box-containing protein
MTAALRLVDPLTAEEPGVSGPPHAPILVVDDSAEKRTALKAVLAPLGYAIVEADSGTAALRCVMAQNFAVSLLDVQMPIMDGFDTAAQIRQRRESEMTPIIFITAYQSDEIRRGDLYAEGAVDFIFAPVPPNELRAKVSVFANLFLRADELARQAQEVQSSADWLKLLTDAAPIGIFRTNSQNRYVYTNPVWSEITGIAGKDAIGREWDSVFASGDDLITELPGGAEARADPWRRYEIRLPGAEDRVALATSRSIPGSEGGIAGWVGTLADVTAAAREREAEHARREAEERYRRIVETTMDGIWLIDADNRTTFVNEPMARMLQTTVAEMQETSIFEFCDDDDLRRVEAELTRRQPGVSARLELQLRRADDTVMHSVLNASSILDEEGTYVGALVMVRDVTERVEQDERRQGLEEQLRRSQQLESIGHLAGGVAHDFNNLLLGIRGFGELALSRLARGDDTTIAKAHIEDMLEAAERATQLTRQLLAFGRRQVLQPQVLDMCDVVGSMEKLLQQLVGDDVEIVTSFPDEPVLVAADRTQLEQVITNLAMNARGAMPNGGKLAFEVAVSSERGVEALLAVSDNGTGMDAETVTRAFEPFFSTKGDAGTGFGLATVHGIVNQSGGRITLNSRPGEGTTFSIFLPLSSEAPTAQSFVPAGAEGGADTILVVDDDPMIRGIVIAMLEDVGYNVLEADGAEAALTLAATWTKPLHLILTDLVMPGGSGGRETAALVQGLFPGARVLYMSGYSDDAVIRDGDAFEPGVGFIQKPFGAVELAQRVREILDLELPPV